MIARHVIATERVLKALANRRRLAIVAHLDARGRVSVGDLAEHIKLSFPATSRHLRALASADLVEWEQTSTSVFYFLSKPRHPLLSASLAQL